MSREHPALGYKIAAELRELGYLGNKKQVQRVRWEEAITNPSQLTRRRRQGLSTGHPQKAIYRNHAWACDFVSDYAQHGGRLLGFNLIDEFTRGFHCIYTGLAIRAADVLAVLREAIEEQGVPGYIRMGRGPEFLAKIVQQWLRENNIKTRYIDPGCS